MPKNIIKPGELIVVDGGDGAGKSTQIKKAKKHYGDRIVVTREPGGSAYAEVIRKVALNHKLAKGANAKTMFALMWAARADHMEKTIIPALKAGKIVLCDRFDDATYAYQIHGQKNHGLKDLFWRMRKVYLGKYVPNHYIFFDVMIKKGLARKAGGTEKQNHFDERKIDFHRRMRSGFKEFYAKTGYTKVDANPDNPEIVWQSFKKVLDRIMK